MLIMWKPYLEQCLESLRNQTIQDIEVGQTVEYAPYTYYVYDVDSSQSYSPDAYGVIFQVSSVGGENKVTYIMETANTPDTPYNEERKYKTNVWYNLSTDNDVNTFNGIIEEADNLDSQVVIIKTSDNSFNEKKSDESFQSLLTSLVNAYFIEVRTTDWSNGIGRAFKDFQTNEYRQNISEVHFPTWEQKTPLVFAYQRCINCSTLGRESPPYVASQIDPNGSTAQQITDKIMDSFNNMQQ